MYCPPESIRKSKHNSCKIRDVSGDIRKISRGELHGNNIEMLVLKETDIKTCVYDSNADQLLIQQGDLVRVGTFLTPTLRSNYSGQIYAIDGNTIFIRLGRPYLISAGTVLRAVNKSLVERSDMLATLVYDKLKTVDIVQGLPKVEEILEARKIKNGCVLAPTEGKAYLKNTKIEIVKSQMVKMVFDRYRCEYKS